MKRQKVKIEEWDFPIQETLLSLNEQNWIPESNIPVFEPGPYKLYDYQKSAIRAFKKHDRLLLFHSPGSGKTITAIYAAYNFAIDFSDHKWRNKIIIAIVPPRVKPHWLKKAREIKWPKHVKFIVGSYHKLIRTDIERILKKLPDPKEIMLILDESHSVKGRQKFYETVYHLIQKISPSKVLLLTGTPIMTNADSVYLYKILLPDDPITQNIEKYIVYDRKPGPGRKAKIIGIYEVPIWRERTHIHIEPKLINQIGDAFSYIVDGATPEYSTAELISYLLQNGRNPLVFFQTKKSLSKVEKILRENYPELKINVVHTHFSNDKIDPSASVTLMTSQLGEGVNMGGLADVVVFHNLPWGADLLVQNLFRIIRADHIPENKVDIFFRDDEYLGEYLEFYISQIRNWVDSFPTLRPKDLRRYFEYISKEIFVKRRAPKFWDEHDYMMKIYYCEAWEEAKEYERLFRPRIGLSVAYTN